MFPWKACQRFPEGPLLTVSWLMIVGQTCKLTVQSNGYQQIPQGTKKCFDVYTVDAHWTSK